MAFALICAAILSLHYYIQLTFVQQGLLNGETAGIWQFAAPNPHSFFWTFAALGYGFMGIALICTASVFERKSERTIRWLFMANGLVGIGFLIGNALGVFMVNILASFVGASCFQQPLFSWRRNSDIRCLSYYSLNSFLFFRRTRDEF